MTELGRVMEVKLLQPEKQEVPKLLTEMGMEMEVKLLQTKKQECQKVVKG